MKQLFIISCFLLLTTVSVFSQNVIAEKSFSQSGITAIEVEGRFCRVEVSTHSQNRVDFEGKITGNARPGTYTIYAEQRGSTLKVWIESEGKIRWSNTKSLLSFKVPATTNVDINNSSGSVQVSGINSELFRLKASSGSIKAQNIKANALVKTSSGSIKIENIEGNVEAQSSSGSQTWQGLKGNIQTSASSGAIRLQNVNGDITAKTSSGSIRSNSCTGKMIMQASSGALSGENIELTDHSSFRTNSGGIRMQLRNDVDQLSFELSASSGGLSI
ncbi:MAG: DUF4097 family beta strand repeat-containing protein, partial [Bacteroidota bacterium]